MAAMEETVMNAQVERMYAIAIVREILERGVMEAQLPIMVVP